MTHPRHEDAPPAPLIVHIIYALGTGGMENGLVNLINHMPPGRYRHAIICLTTASEFAARIEAKDVQVYQLHKPPGNSIGTMIKLLRLLWRLGPAIVHTRNTAALECQVLGFLMPGVKRVHGEHGRDIADLHGTNRRYRMLRRLLAPLIKSFICVSKDLQGWLVNDVGLPPEKIVQIYNGVDLGKFSVDSESGPSALPAEFGAQADNALVVGTVGRLVEVKDQRTLLCAIEHIITKNPPLKHCLKVIVVGDGPLREELELQADKLDLPVHFAGESSNVAAYLKHMDVFVLPSLAEGVSNTILEAMSCGLPVVATEVGGNTELVYPGETGLLFPVGDSSRLAQALLELLADEHARVQLGTAGRKLVASRHSWQAMVSDYISVYDRSLGRG